MAKPMKNNKLPLSAKHNNEAVSYEDVYMNELELDPDLKKELQTKNLAWRFINATAYRKNGTHKSRWIPYKRETKSPVDQIFGVEADGYVRRGDLVLAVKPKTDADRQRAFLAHRAKAQMQVQQSHGEEFRRFAAESGVKTSVSEGFDQTDDDGE